MVSVEERQRSQRPKTLLLTPYNYVTAAGGGGCTGNGIKERQFFQRPRTLLLPPYNYVIEGRKGAGCCKT